MKLDTNIVSFKDFFKISHFSFHKLTITYVNKQKIFFSKANF